MENACDNCGCKEKGKTNETNVEKLWLAIEALQEKMDAMKNWVIAGMATVILQGALVICGLVFAWVKLKG